MNPAVQPVPEPFAQALRELGIAVDAPVLGFALTGGVSSDIWCIQTHAGPVCAKRALPKLRVAADWQAPIERNLYEARWLQAAGAAAPVSAPALIGQHAGLGVLVMAWLPQHVPWKQRLSEGIVDLPTACKVGHQLGRIHAETAAQPALAAQFDSQAIFFDIRLDPYLLASARRHPALAPALHALVERTRGLGLALVHGDVSPKNILVDADTAVFVDAECAVWGDPAFDLAFCLNHLLLKCLWVSSAAPAFLRAGEALTEAYLAQVDWEARESLEQRAATLLPGLLLARVDGKSPVEYLQQEAQREAVRRVAGALLLQPVQRLGAVAQRWREELSP